MPINFYKKWRSGWEGDGPTSDFEGIQQPWLETTNKAPLEDAPSSMLEVNEVLIRRIYELKTGFITCLHLSYLGAQ